MPPPRKHYCTVLLSRSFGGSFCFRGRKGLISIAALPANGSSARYAIVSAPFLISRRSKKVKAVRSRMMDATNRICLNFRTTTVRRISFPNQSHRHALGQLRAGKRLSADIIADAPAGPRRSRHPRPCTQKAGWQTRRPNSAPYGCCPWYRFFFLYRYWRFKAVPPDSVPCQWARGGHPSKSDSPRYWLSQVRLIPRREKVCSSGGEIKVVECA